MLVTNILLGVKKKNQMSSLLSPISKSECFPHPIFKFLYMHNLICQQQWFEKWLASSIAVLDINTQSGFQNETWRTNSRIYVIPIFSFDAKKVSYHAVQSDNY
ncbi:UNVERIFIED_CONTAM: hypothetical protein K2H54_030322 [Gekko kuhli]